MRVNSMFQALGNVMASMFGGTHATREASAPLGFTGRSRGKGQGGGGFIGRRYSYRHWQREAMRRRRALRTH